MRSWMNLDEVWRYLLSCFWLLVPVMLFDLLFAGRLPPAFQPDSFWKDVPAAVSVPENLFRIALFGLTLAMPMAFRGRQAKQGLWLYGAGMAAYFASWAMLILLPGSAWSTSLFGFIAPAATPLLWLTGIGLIAGRVSIGGVAIAPWGYAICAAAFLFFHNFHTLMIYWRGLSFG
jgi:hypothetical protein